MTSESPRDQWANLSDGWINSIEGDGSYHRKGLLDKWMLDAVGDVAGLKVIDLGCGEGRFSRMLSQEGADVTGLDFTERFVEYAQANKAKDETYVLGDMQDLSSIRDASFDLAVSYLSLVDVPDFQRALRETHRILRPDGRLVVCTLQPMVLAGGCWIKAGNEKLHFKLDNYFDEGERELWMSGGMVFNYHRTMSTYVNGFLEAGFRLDGIREPTPSPEQLSHYPQIADNLRVPEFIIYMLSKCDGENG